MFRKVLLTSMALMQSIGRAEADSLHDKIHESEMKVIPSCFTATTFDQWGNNDEYKLNAAINIREEMLTALQKDCSVEVDSYCYWWLENYEVYGNGYFAGYHCVLEYNQKPDSCIENVIKSHCKDGYGTEEDAWITAAIVVASLAMSCAGTLAVIVVMRRRRVRDLELAHDQEVERQEEQDAIWDDLEEKLTTLVGANTEGAAAVHEDFQKMKEDFHCAITLAIMQNPVSLTCRHNYEIENLQFYLQKQKAQHFGESCPCCQEKIEPDEVKINEVMKAAIEMKCRYFTRVVAELEQGKELKAISVRSLSSNSIFNSMRSSQDDSEPRSLGIKP